jgi:hypothetical protein
MNLRTYTTSLFTVVLAALALLLPACESTEEAVLPSVIEIVSGDGQFSKKGTLLPDPLSVKVQYHDLSSAPDVVVQFTVLEGDGVVSKSSSTTDSRGIASTQYTLGPTTGTNRIRAAVTGETNISTEFTATAGDYFCPEEDPEFSQQIAPGGTVEHDLLLFTGNSRLNTSDGTSPIAGLVRLHLEGGFRPSAFSKYEGVFQIPVMDCAFAQNGSFFLAWQDLFDEVVRVKPNAQAVHFAGLETSLGGELTATPAGVLVGCDIYGPFVVGCRDTLKRFDEALFDGSPVDMNPQNQWYEDIYFIDLSDNTLKRLPVDNLVAQGATEVVAQLSADQAAGAHGMECNDNGDVYILVDDEDDDKAILRVTPAGALTVEFDFFTRGSGTAEDAGVQSDLAIRKGVFPVLYTIDTYNNVLLGCYVGQPNVIAEFDPAAGGFDPEAISTAGFYGERVGLVVIP